MEQQFIEQARNYRNRAGFVLFDTVWIGRGAKAFDQNFYEDFQTAASEEKISFFAGRKSPQDAWTNRRDARNDWPFSIEFITLEMITLYPALGRVMSSPADADFLPALWNQISRGMSLEMTMGDNADIIFKGPLSQIPGGTQPTGSRFDASAAPSTSEGNSGIASKREFLSLGEPIKVPVTATLGFDIKISNPYKRAMLDPAFPVPGDVEINTPGGKLVAAQWYGIRATLHGTRETQIIGARSAR